MKNRRWNVGVLTAALLVPTLAACTSDTAEPTVEPSTTVAADSSAIPADARQALLASTKGIAEGNFSFSISGGAFNAAGKVHAASRSAEISVASGDPASLDPVLEVHMIFVDTDVWAVVERSSLSATAMPTSPGAGKYHRIDRSRVKGVKQLEFDFDHVDLAGSEALTKAITEARQTADRLYEGTIDATRVTDSNLLDAQVVKALAGRATAVPFSAKLDDQGRLLELGLEVPAAGDTPAQFLLVTYAEYGTTPATEKPPADEVVEASEDFYRLLR